MPAAGTPNTSTLIAPWRFAGLIPTQTLGKRLGTGLFCQNSYLKYFSGVLNLISRSQLRSEVTLEMGVTVIERMKWVYWAATCLLHRFALLINPCVQCNWFCPRKSTFSSFCLLVTQSSCAELAASFYIICSQIKFKALFFFSKCPDKHTCHKILSQQK